MQTEREKLVGVVLSAAAVKEFDSRICVLLATGEKIFLYATGVKKPNAKLKFVAQPFALCEFVVMNSKIITATCIESFFDITKNYSDYSASCVMLKAAEFAPMDAFMLLVNCLREILFNQGSGINVLIYFFINLLKQSGFELDFSKCSVCGGSVVASRFLSSTYGGVVCGLHKGMDYIEIEPMIANTLKIISNTKLDKIITVKIINPKEIIDVLGKIYQSKFEPLPILKTVLK